MDNRLILALAVIAAWNFAIAGACPEGTEQYSCITCEGVACMNEYNESICKGQYYPDYNGYYMWVGGSEGCTCYCPYSLYLDAKGDSCKGSTCPDRCKGNYLQTQGNCNLSTGACKYGKEEYCGLGCDSTALACVKPADLCAGKTCGNECEGGYTLKTSGKCAPATGQCAFDSIYCPNGCDADSAKRGVCKNEDKCAAKTCEDKCIDDDYLGVGEQATCDKATGDCDYSAGRKKCPFGCDKEKNECKQPEICDNNIDDDKDTYLDCEDPDCKDSLDCVCKKMDGGSFRTLGISEKPSSSKLNIIFVGKGYDKIYPKADSREAKVLADVTASANLLMGTSPFDFSSNRGKVAVYVTNAPSKDLTSPNSARSIAMARCNAPANAQFIIFDPIGSSEDCGKADLCGNKADVYTSCDVGTTFLHEFGHSFGCLWDEYTYGSDWNPINWLSAVEFKYSNRATNCYDAASESGCRATFNVDKCYAGCTAASWYRTSQYSVMWDQKVYQSLVIDPASDWATPATGNGQIRVPNYYNDQSAYVINQKLEGFQ